MEVVVPPLGQGSGRNRRREAAVLRDFAGKLKKKKQKQQPWWLNGGIKGAGCFAVASGESWWWHAVGGAMPSVVPWRMNEEVSDREGGNV